MASTGKTTECLTLVSCLEKTPTSYRKCFLNAPAVHPKSYSSLAVRVYGFYYQPRELTAIGRACPGLGDGCSGAPTVGGFLAGQPRSRPAPFEEALPKSRRPFGSNHPARAGSPGNEGERYQLGRAGTGF